MKSEGVSRFLVPQNEVYLRALAEISAGKKQSHWMWYIFPQIKGLGHSETANFYAIKDLGETKEYLNHPVLSKNLIEIAEAALEIKDKAAFEIFGTPDDLKLRSSMTLFAAVSDAHPVFKAVLQKYFDGGKDERTMRIIDKELKDDTV
jgi:uncharacterized protein (DUF1810 family)